MIKNIIFDLAGVLLNLNIERDTKALQSVGLPDYMECLKNPDMLRPLTLYLNGLMEETEFIKSMRPFCRPDVTDGEILWSMDAVLDDIPLARLQRLVELRQHYKVFLLSNLYDSAWRYTIDEFKRQGYTLEDCFDRAFFSQQIHMAKPDPRIFQYVFEQTGILPSETLYFDDTRENIESGHALGLHTCLVPMNQLESCAEYANL